MTRLSRALLPLVAALALPGGAAAQTFPKFTGFVVDAANVIPAEQETALTARLDELQRTTKRQMVVATVPGLEGYDIRDYGYRLGRAWGVGLKDADNGLILLVAPNERKVAIEVGTGLEPIVTDALSSVVINQTILPRFKAGDLPGGIVAGTDALAAQLSAAPEEQQAKVDAAVREFDATHRRSGRASGGGGVPIGLVFWGLVAAFVVLSMVRGRGGSNLKGQRYRGGRRGGGGSAWPIVLWTIANEIERGSRRGGGGGFGGFGGGGGGGGWGGGGFGGGGGGSFGGGGASGGW